MPKIVLKGYMEVYGSICREYRACDLFDKIKVCLDITQEFINNEKCN